MKVVLFDKKTETHVHIDNVTIFKQETEVIGFSETKFRYIWYIRQSGSIYEKSYPCNRYLIHTIIAWKENNYGENGYIYYNGNDERHI